MSTSSGQCSKTYAWKTLQKSNAELLFRCHVPLGSRWRDSHGKPHLYSCSHLLSSSCTYARALAVVMG